MLFTGELNNVTDEHVRTDGDRFAHNAGFVALDFGHFRGLQVSGHVLVDETDTALLGDGDREAGLGHCVHHSGHHRNIDAQIAG